MWHEQWSWESKTCWLLVWVKKSIFILKLCEQRCLLALSVLNFVILFMFSSLFPLQVSRSTSNLCIRCDILRAISSCHINILWIYGVFSLVSQSTRCSKKTSYILNKLRSPTWKWRKCLQLYRKEKKKNFVEFCCIKLNVGGSIF